MKKLFTALICAAMVLGLTGCGGRDPLSDDDVKKHLSEKGYTFKCDNDGFSFCGFANNGVKKAILYSDESGFSFMNENSLYSIDKDNVSEGNDSASEMKKDYKKLIEDADVTGEELSKLLEKEYNSFVSKAEAEKAEAENKIYNIGDEITVSANGTEYFKFKINSVKETNERNQFSDKKPQQVVVINYSYENLNIDEDFYIGSSSFTIIDEGSNVADTYPAGANVYAKACPKGAKTKGEEAYGLDKKSKTITLRLEEYLPGNYEKISRNFNLKIK